MIEYTKEIENLGSYDWVDDMLDDTLTTEQQFFSEEDIKHLLQELT